MENCFWFLFLFYFSFFKFRIVSGVAEVLLSLSLNCFPFFPDEFKPASIDKNQRGTLHKSKDNKVTVEFQNNQPGKPKVTFEGISEDYKENDAVLFFDGESFRLERLHRAVKRLRHNRMQGETITTAAASAGPSDASSPPVGKVPKYQPPNKEAVHVMPVGSLSRTSFYGLMYGL